MIKSYNLRLTGNVGGSNFKTSKVTQVLDSLKGQEVTVLIDSRGGDLATALSISSAFRNHGNVKVHFVGLNASAATIAALGAKHVSMDSSAMYLVHQCSVTFFEWANLNADQFNQLIENATKQMNDLNKIDQNIAEMYGARCKKPAADLLAVMKTGAWLSAKEAKEWGFIDEIEECGEPMMTLADANALIKAGVSLPALDIQNPEAASIIDKIVKQATGFFSKLINEPKSYQQPIKSTTQMNKNTTLLALMAVLACDGIDFDADGNTSLSASQVKKINDHIDSLNQQLTEANDKIDELSKKPGDSSNHADPSASKFDDSTSHDSTTDFIKVSASASKIFNSLP